VQMIRIQKECRLPICVRACRHFEFKVLVGNILLMIVHSIGAESLNIFVDAKNKNQPDNPHQLPSNYGITAVCTDAEIKFDPHVLVCLHVKYIYNSLVKVDRLNFVLKKEFDVLDSGGLVEETLI
jgi:hypothetical protein